MKFAGESRDRVGNDTDWGGDNYSQIVKNLTECNTVNAEALKDAVNDIYPGGATQADYGMEHAQTVLSSARSGAKKVVIFFTDGTPTSGSRFEPRVASSAIATAKSLKEAGTVVYTVGIFSGADPDASVTADKTSNENKFMQAVSSNYPLPLTLIKVIGCSVPITGTSAPNLPMPITIWQLPTRLS